MKASDAAYYASTLDIQIPVTADVAFRLLEATPWTGAARPGKCILTPTMEILRCHVGEDDDEAFAAIVQHAAGR
ncbi:MAG: hypothetical protein KF718_31600 [Polyangiaceae bacterium]|nr:hypothetical protein [Polyangiaceae bacterium]